MHQDNYNTFSIKIENLFVDTCAFFDSLCQTHIIESKTGGKNFIAESSVSNFARKISIKEYFNIDDYQKILESEYHVSSFEINLNSHIESYVGNPNYYIDQTNRCVDFYLIKPFESWANSTNPDWWRNYTSLKHNRLDNIKLGNFKNLTFALAATFIILSIRNESIFKSARIDKEIYNVFFPNYWTVSGISTSRGNISFT
jgi:hypothetical protein